MRTPRHSHLYPSEADGLAVAPAGRASAERASPRRGGFSMLELVIVAVILGVLAALVVPQFSSAAINAREDSLRDELRYLRTQIMIYRAQHRGVSPGYPGGDPQAQPTRAALAAQLTQYSDAAGRTSPRPGGGFRYGPYLTHLPENPLTGSAEVEFVAAGAAFPACASGIAGWIYQPSTGTLKADASGADAQGVPYFDY